MFRSVLALLMIALAAPVYAGSRFGGGSHGGSHGGSQGGGSQGGGSQGGFQGGDSHDDGFAFQRRGRRARDLFIVYGNCGFGFDCGVYDPGYGYEGGAGTAATRGSYSGGGYSGGGYSGGGYVPDPVGAEIPAVIFPTSCWVRRAGYDSSGASVGQVLINLCHPSDSVTVTRVSARARPPNTGSGAPQSPQ
jgi:hypothetical protein